MTLVIGPLDGLGLDVHVGHGLGLEHDLGLGVAQAINLVGITSQHVFAITIKSTLYEAWRLLFILESIM